MDKMTEAQGKGDQRVAAIYFDSAMAMQDPNCVAKEPQQPDDYYESRRAVDARAEKTAIKSSGFTRSELAMARERAEALLRGGTSPGDISASEKSAVAARAGELRPLLGIRDAQPARTTKPAAASAPTAPPAGSTMSPAMTARNACIQRNLEKNEKQIQVLAERGAAAQQAGNTNAMIAISDTLQRLQNAGCGTAR